MRVGPGIAVSTEPQSSNDPIMIGADHSIRIDLMKLQAPSNIYDADFAWIIHSPGSVSFFFAKRSLSEEKKLRTRLEMRFPPEILATQLWERTQEFHGRVKEYTDKWPKDENRNKLQPEGWSAEKDHSEWANIETMAHSGTEASIDFYQLPPFGVAQFIQGRGSSQLMVLPVVRVLMSVFELDHLLESVALVVSQVQEYLPKAAIKDGQTEEG
jgi:hypothetical protein